MKITLPKFVKKAGQYCITTVEKPEKGKIKQTVLWFSTFKEANEKYKELNEIK